MTTASSSLTDRQRWDRHVSRLGAGARHPTRVPISVERVVDCALAVVRDEGYDVLSMRRVAEALDASPGAIYGHVRDKRELDDLMLGALCAGIELPVPRPDRWLGQAVEVCRQLRDIYLRHPGISRVALASSPRSPDVLRVFEGLLAVLTTGGVDVARAAWAIDAAFAYTSAYSAVSSRRQRDDGADGSERVEAIELLESLPEALFPITTRHARDITSGKGHERFDFALGLLFGGLSAGRP